MCLIFVGWRAHARDRLVVAANRDEFHARPSAPAAPWGGDGGDNAAPRAWPQGDILAGRDLEAGGTWLGVGADGRFAALTNFRAAPSHPHPPPDAPSRGRLVVDFLQGALGAREHAARLAREAERYHGFNLLLADRDELFYVTNRGSESERMMALADGCHGLSNDHLNAPWPKVTEGLVLFQAALREQGAGSDALFEMLGPGAPTRSARVETSRFIRGGVYGTRASTVVRIAHDGALCFEERSFDNAAAETGRIAWKAAPPSSPGAAPVLSMASGAEAMASPRAAAGGTD